MHSEMKSAAESESEEDFPNPFFKTKPRTQNRLRKIVEKEGPARIAEYQKHQSSFRTHQELPGTPQNALGSVVTSNYTGGVYLVVGYGITGGDSNEIGCYGCKISDHIHKKAQWIGPEKRIKQLL
jgi:hypothetical protein